MSKTDISDKLNLLKQDSWYICKHTQYNTFIARYIGDINIGKYTFINDYNYLFYFLVKENITYISELNEKQLEIYKLLNSK